MSLRVMSAGADDAFQGDSLIRVFLGAFDFSSGMVRLWTGSDVGEIKWGGHTWYGCGALASIGDIEETAESRAVGLELVLTGIPLVSGIDGVEIDILQIANDERWQQRPARIYCGLLNRDFTWNVEPFQVRKGLMDVMQLQEGSVATIKLTLESPTYDGERSEEVNYTAEAQRARKAGDKGCDQIAALQQKDVLWAG